MELPKVEGTQVRGKIYHLNLRIKPEIQDLYGGKTHLRGSLRTSDPKVAIREVKRRKAELNDQELALHRKVEVDDLVANLTPEQRRAYDEAGGLEGLLGGFERTRPDIGMALAEDDDYTEDYADDFDNDGDDFGDDFPGPSGFSDDLAEALRGMPADEQEVIDPEPVAPPARPAPDELPPHRPIAAYARHEEPDPDEGADDLDIEDELFTLADLVEEYTHRLDYETAAPIRHVVRRFTELHGDVPFEALNATHLHDFAVAAKGLPADMSARLPDGTPAGDLAFHELVEWAERTRAKRISETTRFQYVSMLKELMGFGIPRYRRGDPWTDYRLQIVKREPRPKHEEARSKRFARNERSLNGLLIRALEIAIVGFVGYVLILLWLD